MARRDVAKPGHSLGSPPAWSPALHLSQRRLLGARRQSFPRSFPPESRLPASENGPVFLIVVAGPAGRASGGGTIACGSGEEEEEDGRRGGGAGSLARDWRPLSRKLQECGSFRSVARQGPPVPGLCIKTSRPSWTAGERKLLARRSRHRLSSSKSCNVSACCCCPLFCCPA